MKRYNVNGMPVEFVEVLNGYWVKHSDYEQAVLDYNKSASRMWEVETSAVQAISVQWSDKVEAQQRKIIYLSVACFALAAALLFKVLG